MVKYTLLLAATLVAAAPALSSDVVDNEIRSQEYDAREVMQAIYGRDFRDTEINERALPVGRKHRRTVEPLDAQLERRLVVGPGGVKRPSGLNIPKFPGTPRFLGHGPVVNSRPLEGKPRPRSPLFNPRLTVPLFRGPRIPQLKQHIARDIDELD